MLQNLRSSISLQKYSSFAWVIHQMYLFSAISADLKQKATVSPVLHQRYFQGYKVFNFISPEPKVEIRRRRVHIFVFFSRTTRPISTNLGTCKAPLGEGSSSFFFKWRAFSKGGQKYIHFTIFFSRTTQRISTKLGTNHPWVKGNSSWFKWWDTPLSKGTNPDPNEIAKIYWRNLKIAFYRTIGTISTKLCTKHSWVMGT